MFDLGVYAVHQPLVEPEQGLRVVGVPDSGARRNGGRRVQGELRVRLTAAA